MRFTVLGAVSAVVNGVPVPITRPRQRAILAFLLVNRNTSVSTDRIVAALWDGDRPATAHNQVQTDLSILRRLIRTGGARDPVRTRSGGYRLEVDVGELDLDEFTAQRDAARASTDRDVGVRLLRSGLALWSGEPLEGVTAAYAPAHRQYLAELRLQTYEQLFELELELGRHDAVATEIGELVSANPLRERLVCQLMLALYRGARPAEALDAGRRMRALLAEEHGLDPGHAFDELERALLRRDPALDLPDGDDQAVNARVPQQLPGDPSSFVGRGDHLVVLDKLAEVPAGRRGRAIVALTGTPGAGKTALAVHWGHRSRSMFPDGQLYVNLRGFSGTAPMTPLQALGVLLSGLGVAPGRQPVEVDAAASLFRTLTAGLRVLVVLDNAAGTTQVRPLLAGGPGCFTIVVSRGELTGLVAQDGATRMSLDVLPADEAAHLLDSLLGPRRAGPVPELAALCGHLPLAIRIAAANLLERPHLTVADYVERLRTGDRLSAFEAPDDPDSAVRRAFDLTYQALDEAARRLFRFIGIAPGLDLSTAAVGALLDAGVDRQLTSLLRHHLVVEDAPGRYSIHDLIRVYSTEQSAVVDSASHRAAAVERVLGYYLDRARAAAATAYPHVACLDAGAVAPLFPDASAAMSWLEGERDNLVSVIVRPPLGAERFGWLLADQLRGFFALRRYDDDWLRTARSAGESAAAHDDAAGAAAGYLSLGWAYRCTGQYADALHHLDAALEASERAGWRRGQATALTYLATVHSDRGSPDEALRYAERALALSSELPPVAEALIRNTRGILYLHRGMLHPAATDFGLVLDIMRDAGSLSGQGTALTNRGLSRMLQGRHDDARRDLVDGLVRSRRAGDRVGECLAITTLADLHLRRHEIAVSRRLMTAGVRLARDLADQFCLAYALTVDANLCRAAGDPARALQVAAEALGVARSVANREYEVEALISLGRAARDSGDLDAATTWLTEALEIAVGSGYRLCEGRALRALATVSRRQDSALASGRDCPAAPAGQAASAAGNGRVAAAPQ